jgi:DNA-binding winged helix-turn-helix (wHTH) protein/Flp pilus assembly protein TadD
LKEADQIAFEFGPFRLDPTERLLLRDGEAVPVTPKAFDTLLALVDRRGRLVEKSELMTAVWEDAFVEEGNIAVTVSMLRKALGDENKDPTYIQTIPKRGYRFICEVHEVAKSDPDMAPSNDSPSVSAKLPRASPKVGISILALSCVAITIVFVHTRINQKIAWKQEPVAQSMPGGRETTIQKHLPNSRVYQAYLEGRYFWNKRTDESLRRSVEYFQRATIEDPQYAPAFAGLADSYTLLASFGVEPASQAYPNAKVAALKALELDPSLAEAHTSLGMVSFYYEWNWQNAENEFRRSIELDPNYPLAHAWYALDLAAMGRLEESIAQVQRAAELDDLSLSINTELGRVYYCSRQYDRAIAAYRKAIDLDPQFARAHTRLGVTYAAQRHFADAVREFKQARSLSGPDPYLDGLLGFAQAFSGNARAARVLQEELTERSKHEYVPAFSMALISIGLRDRDQAFEWLSKSYQDRSTYMVWVRTDPLLDSVRSDPRFSVLLNQMGL